MEVGTNESDPIPVRGEPGPRRVHGRRISVDPDEENLRRRVENVKRVPPSAEGCVDEDAAVSESRKKEFDDPICEDRVVFHSKPPLLSRICSCIRRLADMPTVPARASRSR